jgi:hypothetical protein
MQATLPTAAASAFMARFRLRYPIMLMELALYAGAGVDAVTDLPPAGELVRRLWEECLAARDA